MEGVHDAPSTLIWTPSLWPPTLRNVRHTLRAWPSVHTLPSRFDTQHIYGGIPPTGGVVCEERLVRRAPDGTFVSIDGLVNGASPPRWPSSSVSSLNKAFFAAAAMLAAGLILGQRSRK